MLLLRRVWFGPSWFSFGGVGYGWDDKMMWVICCDMMLGLASVSMRGDG